MSETASHLFEKIVMSKPPSSPQYKSLTPISEPRGIAKSESRVIATKLAEEIAVETAIGIRDSVYLYGKCINGCFSVLNHPFLCNYPFFCRFPDLLKA